MLRIAPIASLLAIIACALFTSCTYPATEVLVVVDTDIPVSQQLALRVTTRRGASGITSATPPDRTFVVGGHDGGAGLPASFAIVPHEGDPLDSFVTLRVEAQSGSIALRRLARFRFTPHQHTTLRIFLTLRCATPVSGCTHTSPCTQQDLCEERGEACGPEGLCVPVVTMTMPATDDGGPSRMDVEVPRDATDAIARLDVADVGMPGDVPPPPMDSGISCGASERPCGPSCIPSGNCCVDGECGANRACAGGACVCVAGMHDCGGTCVPNSSCCGDGECGAGRTCSGGACVCLAGTRDCGGNCIPSGNCCSDGDCGASRACAGGTCVCMAGTHDCGGTCVPNSSCCGDGECGASRTCSGGACVCVAGTRDCGGNCIPSGGCCSDGECGGGGHVCSGGACICGAGTRDCGGTCIPTGSCCGDFECGGGGHVCSGGACICVGGTRDCGGTCIPSTNCCSDPECGGGGHVCSGGACVCAAGTRACGGACIPNGTCCSDADCSAPLSCPSPGSACSCPAVARTPIYRFRRTSNNDHVYSISATELSGASGWVSEGIRFYLYPEPCPSGMLRLLRFVNTSNNQHFYTSDAAEAAGLPPNLVPEGAIGCVATSTVCGSTPLFRKLTCSNGHFYSTDRAEFDAMCGSDEGSVGEAWNSM